MDSNVEFFPKNLSQALGLLYVQRQDLTGKTPSEILEIYMAAEQEIAKKHHTLRKANNLDW